MSRTQSEQLRIRFLQDRPADQDFFGTHRTLAEAVASALASNPELRTVGLLGKWGSGKSTVLRELEARIAATSELQDIRIFTFDAWEHQGEPIRRSFLESLFGFLKGKQLISDDWQADIDLLAGRLAVTENIETPQLTVSAKQMLWALSLVPFGLSVFGLDTLQDGLGSTTTAAGQWALFTALICFVVPMIFIAENLFLRSAKPDPDTQSDVQSAVDDDVIGLIINKKVNRVQTKTIKSPDPTVIDFSETCERLVSDVKQKGFRLLCIIDNLDRLPAHDALEMWSAIRSIFSNIRMNGSEQGHPFVLVPMDHSALLKSFGSEGNDERAKSFIDKTFDLTFRVPPPVRSDWKAFLRSQFEIVFGKEAIEDRTMYFIEAVFDSQHKTANEFPTPRVINRFINSVAATWLARRNDDFPLAIVSLFVANFDEIENSVLEFTQRDDLISFDSDFGEWRDQIAALYFGVPTEKSRQVLLEGPLRQVISQAEAGDFKMLMTYPGAIKVFDDILRGYRYDPADQNSQSFIFNSAAMLEAVEGNEEIVRRSWDFLLSRLVECIPTPAASEFDQRVGPFLRNLRDRKLTQLLSAAVRWLSILASSSDESAEFEAIGNSYQALKRAAGSREIPRIVLRGEPGAVVKSLYWINGNADLEGSTSSEVEFSKLAPELTRLVDDEDSGWMVSEVLSFRRHFPTSFPKENFLSLGPIRNASIGVLQTDGASPGNVYAARNLGVMAPITKEAGQEVDAMIDAGHLQSRLDESLQEDEAEAIGTFAALAISRAKSFAADRGDVSNSQRLQSIETNLNAFVTNPLNAIWNAQAAGHSPLFMDQVLQHIVRERDFSSEELDQISNNLEFYFTPLSKTTRHVLARKIGEEPARVEKIGKLNPSGILVDILTPLLRAGVGDASRQCKNTVESLSSDSWKSFLKGEADWPINLLEKCPGEFKLTMQSKAVEAAIELVDEQSAALSISERARLRKLVSRFNVFAERKLIDAILAHSPHHTRGALALVKALKEESLAAIRDHVTAEGFTTLLGGFSLLSDGRDWLEDQTPSLQKAVDRFDKPSRNFVLDFIDQVTNRKPKVRANSIEVMAHRLGLE